jgi:hypothetical protein
MTDTTIFAFAFGAFFGALFAVMAQLTSAQEGYTQGRESVLSRVVTIGEPASPCRLDIPLSVLAEMVSMGAVDWHERCAAAVGEAGNDAL